jgi:hypothetical protein
MAHPRVSAKRFTKNHCFKQNILHMSIFSRMLGNTDQRQPGTSRIQYRNLNRNLGLQKPRVALKTACLP